MLLRLLYQCLIVQFFYKVLQLEWRIFYTPLTKLHHSPYIKTDATEIFSISILVTQGRGLYVFGSKVSLSSAAYGRKFAVAFCGKDMQQVYRCFNNRE